MPKGDSMSEYTAIDVIRITSNIKKVYDKLFLYELNNSSDKNIHEIIEYLKHIINLEEKMYQHLSDSEIKILENYIQSEYNYTDILLGSENIERKDNIDITRFDRDKFIPLVRIEKRLEKENISRRYKYSSITNYVIQGVSLFYDQMDENIAGIFVEEMNNAIHYNFIVKSQSLYKQVVLDEKYCLLFSNIALEKYIIYKDLLFNNDTKFDKLLKLSEKYNNNPYYIVGCDEYYFDSIKNNLNDIVNGEIEDEYLDMYLDKIKAYLTTTYKSQQENIYNWVKLQTKSNITLHTLKLFGMVQEVCKPKVKTM